MKYKLSFVFFKMAFAISGFAQVRPASRLVRNLDDQAQQCLEPLIPMEEALALAKKGDGKGYFQLALRYADSGDATRDSKISLQFLKKACDASYSNAVFCSGLVLENSLSLGLSLRPSRELNMDLFRLRPNVNKYIGVRSIYNHYLSPPQRNSNVWECFGVYAPRPCITNEDLVAIVYDKYNKAAALGVSAATNEIARLDKRMAIVRDEIKALNSNRNEKRKMDEAVKDLIAGESVASTNDRMKNRRNVARMEYEYKLEQQVREEKKKMYKDWPHGITADETKEIYEEVKRKFGVIVFDAYEKQVDRDKVWRKGCGMNADVGVLVWDGNFCMRFNNQGVLERVESEPEEIKWIRVKRSEILKSKRETWARKHSMTLEEAKKGYEECFPFSSKYDL